MVLGATWGMPAIGNERVKNEREDLTAESVTSRCLPFSHEAAYSPLSSLPLMRGSRWLFTLNQVREAEGIMSVNGKISSARPSLRTEQDPIRCWTGRASYYLQRGNLIL